jgi:RNA polymerase sigma factor (sigma-70 family)
MTDAALVERARAGDAQALDRLLGSAQHDLRRVARRTCAIEDVDDAIQETLTQAARRLGTLRTVAAFGGWLVRILVRTCRRLLLGRSQRAEVTAGDDIAAHGVPVELRRDLVQALAGLPPAYREVLILRDVEEWTAPEVASELGVSAEAVKSRLHRARQMMRERLDASAYWR